MGKNRFFVSVSRGVWAAMAVGLALMVSTSCGHRIKVKPPEVLLTEEQMIDVLTDAYLIEAQLSQRKASGEDVTALQTVYYEDFFEHYQLTDSLFVQNLRYYTYQPAVLERIMDSVNGRFVKGQEERSKK